MSDTKPSSGPGPEDPQAQETAVARILYGVLTSLPARVPAAALETLNPARISAAIDWQSVGEDLLAVAEPIRVVIANAARAEIPRQQFAKADVGVDIDLAIVNRLAVDYADQHAGRLVIEISDKLRQTIADIISGNVGGELPRGVVLAVLNAVIPLPSSWAQSVSRAAARAYAAAMADGGSIATATRVAERTATNRAANLTRSRARNIARTEAMTAMNEGKLAAWHEQVGNGWISPDSFKEWTEGRDPCERCAPLVGELVPYDQPFSNGRQMPPEHPSCRCTANILPPDDDIRAEYEAQLLRRVEEVQPLPPAA